MFSSYRYLLSFYIIIFTSAWRCFDERSEVPPRYKDITRKRFVSAMFYDTLTSSTLTITANISRSFKIRFPYVKVLVCTAKKKIVNVYNMIIKNTHTIFSLKSMYRAFYNNRLQKLSLKHVIKYIIYFSTKNEI